MCNRTAKYGLRGPSNRSRSVRSALKAERRPSNAGPSSLPDGVALVLTSASAALWMVRPIQSACKAVRGISVSQEGVGLWWSAAEAWTETQSSCRVEGRPRSLLILAVCQLFRPMRKCSHVRECVARNPGQGALPSHQ